MRYQVLVMTGWMGLSLVGNAMAVERPENAPHFEQKHPRQTEVLKRTDRERHRIDRMYKDGKITKDQRDQMLAQVKDVRKEDVADAKANSKDGKMADSYITNDQQKVMNQQENQVNQELKSNVKADAPAAPSAH